MPFDVTIEINEGEENRLREFEAAQKVTNVPMVGHAVVTKADGETEKVPCATVVAVEEPDDG